MEKGFRAPIVCVLGHVDHGKTTLLDVIRKTNVALREVGGITQGIGASVVSTNKDKKITFIDTPGHATFSKMRSRGANVADIAVLVVDASDGVKPQTVEALKIIKQEQLPFIVAMTKIDLPAVNIEGTKGQLEKEGVTFEGRGGSTPLVLVSAKEGKGINELLETITLTAEIHDIKGDPLAPLESVVIESSKENRGVVGTVIVRNGTLKVGDVIKTENAKGKVRALFNGLGKSVKEVFPGEPAKVLGFEEIPSVGGKVFSGTLEGDNLFVREKIQEIKEGDIPILIKAKDAGALEALEGSLPNGIKAILKGVGDVNESDILSAKSADARVFAYGVSLSGSVSKLAETEGVTIEKFVIIYELIERLEEILKKGEVEILGKAEILASFPFNQKKIAGCKVITGKIALKDNLLIVRGDKELGKVRAVSIKKQKEEISQVKQGEEFGLLFEPQLDFLKGDVLLSIGK